MAKLSARGAEVLWRASRDVDLSKASDWTRENVVRKVAHIAMRSDGHVLQRTVTWFKAGPYDAGKDRRHDYGWKLYRRAKPGVDSAAVREAFEKAGYTSEVAS